jgi:hypothetical protein
MSKGAGRAAPPAIPSNCRAKASQRPREGVGVALRRAKEQPQVLNFDVE